MSELRPEIDLAELLERARAQVAAAQPPVPRPALDDPHATGVGMAADGLIRAQMGADGRLVGLSLDERTASLPRHELQQEIIEAVNAAWASLRGAGEAEAAVSAIDPAALAARLAEVQEQGMRSMHRITEGLADAMRQIERQTRR
ncbi:YbaB/EbfC family nucleoid-associated protein [Catenuloplanes indicus]|uniref:DNA-binding protein YbaB n=1 Tax=Catenuloplanes indicus TaxID=137267 RepID=A0AAE4AXW1_9ACTN|nr:YbaB/EbfC family nucleoid-associated protein [Catenuloplanes indicus]MDQ0364428.1 DNA-binding protein YbaB [Catenuloplanes indicus]